MHNGNGATPSVGGSSLLTCMVNESRATDLSDEGTTLTISAERSVPRLEGAEWSVAERPFGSYTRQLVLGRTPATIEAVEQPQAVES